MITALHMYYKMGDIMMMCSDDQSIIASPVYTILYKNIHICTFGSRHCSQSTSSILDASSSPSSGGISSRTGLETSS